LPDAEGAVFPVLNPDLDPDLDPDLARRCTVMSLVQRVREESKRRRITIKIRKRMKSTRERSELSPNHTHKRLFQERGEELVFPGFSRPGPFLKQILILLVGASS